MRASVVAGLLLLGILPAAAQDYDDGPDYPPPAFQGGGPSYNFYGPSTNYFGGGPDYAPAPQPGYGPGAYGAAYDGPAYAGIYAQGGFDDARMDPWHGYDADEDY